MGGIAGIGSGPGALITGSIGGILGGGANIAGQLLGHGGPNTSSTSMHADSHNAVGNLSIPAPEGTIITAGYGPRRNRPWN
jgi:hypothetical protein